MTPLRARRNLTAAVISAALVLLFPSVALAHHLPLWGPLFADTTVVIQVTDGFPGGEHLARIDSARNEWNAVGTTRPLTRQAARIANFNPSTTCPATAGVVTFHWRETGALGQPNALGVTWHCTIGADRHSGNIAIDTDRDWYTGTGDANDGFLQQCIPSCQSDLWSVLSHELGHAMAFDHFGEDDPVCPNSDIRHTMCPSIYGGTERQRSFEIHEEETFHINY